MNIRRLATASALGLGLASVLLAGASAETLKFGIIAPLTGGGASWGLACDQAARIAAAEYNAKGGLEVGGKKYEIQIISYDDQFKTADAVAAYNRLVNQDGAKFALIQTSNGGTALKGNIEDDKIITLSSGYGGSLIDANTKFMYRMYSAPRDFMPGLAAWMKGYFQKKRIVLINPNIEGAFESVQLANKLYPENGFEVLTSDLYEMSQKDFAPLITKVVALNPDIIDVGNSAPATAGLIVRQARELGYKGQFFKSGGPAPVDLVAAAGKEAAEGMIVFLYADPANEGYKRIVDAYKKNMNGQEPNQMFLPAYDGINIVLRAIQKAGDINDTTKVRAAMAQVMPVKSTQGDELALGGKNTYGSDQQIQTTNYVGVIKDGVPVIIGKIR